MVKLLNIKRRLLILWKLPKWKSREFLENSLPLKMFPILIGRGLNSQPMNTHNLSPQEIFQEIIEAKLQCLPRHSLNVWPYLYNLEYQKRQCKQYLPMKYRWPTRFQSQELHLDYHHLNCQYNMENTQWIATYRSMHWKNLTTQDILFLRGVGVCNGCGGAWERFWHIAIRWFLQWILSILRAVFVEASCQVHDFSYWQSLFAIMTAEEIERIKKEDPKLFRKLLRERRKICDQWFFYQILADIQKMVQDPFAFVWYTLLALIFYGAVRSLGWVYFNSLP